jgi:sugar lactone lactonase YvrE
LKALEQIIFKYEFKNNEFFKWHNYLNSTIETIIPDNPLNYMRVDGAIIDKSGNLFLANMDLGAGIKVLLNDGVTWTQLSYPEVAKPNLGQILIFSHIKIHES